ncbi:hypothetical protein, partial [Vibrio harveyi]|uniref:hypothetical protein n=3 Tax=Vibrio harveyi TaxID=669 RepID=UPI000A4F78C9
VYIVKKYVLFSFFLFFVLINCVLINALLLNYDYFYIPSFIYELYKIGTVFFILPMYFLFRYNNVDFIIRSLNIFMVINAFVLIAQYLFGVDIINNLGISYDLSHYAERNRPTGLTHNANVIGVLSLFVYLFSRIDCVRLNNGSRYLGFISIFVLVLSSSKASLMCFVLYFLLSRLSFRNVISIIVFVIIVTISIIKFNLYGITDKLSNYAIFIDALMEGDLIKPGSVEGRLWGWYLATILFSHSYLGYGLGTWGDFSSRINPYVDSMNYYEPYSDSALSHYIVEQGFFVVIYLLSIYFFIPKNKERWKLFLIFMLLLITNYGFSQSLFCFGFWLLICGYKYSEDSIRYNGGFQ